MKEKLPNKKEPIGKNKKTRHLMHEARFDGKIEKSKKKATAKESATGVSIPPDTDAVLHKDLSKLVGQALRGDPVLSASNNVKNGNVEKAVDPAPADFVEEPVTPVTVKKPDKIIVEPEPEPMGIMKENMKLPNIETQLVQEPTDPLEERKEEVLSDKEKFRANPNRVNIWSIQEAKPNPPRETLRGPISGVRTMAESVPEEINFEDMTPEQIEELLRQQEE